MAPDSTREGLFRQRVDHTDALDLAQIGARAENSERGYIQNGDEFAIDPNRAGYIDMRSEVGRRAEEEVKDARPELKQAVREQAMKNFDANYEAKAPSHQESADIKAEWLLSEMKRGASIEDAIRNQQQIDDADKQLNGILV